MKVAILSDYSRIGGVTGDCVQANKTADALHRVGVTALRCYIRPSDSQVYGPRGELLGSWTEVLGNFDIVHAMVPFRVIRKLPKIRAKFACYTVFWRSFNCIRVNVYNSGHLGRADVKDLLYVALSRIGIKTYRFFNGYDLLLPNSEDEIRCVKRFCPVKKDVRFASVPNAVDALPEDIQAVDRAAVLPQKDYVVVPAFFSHRKNQLGLIRALKDTDLPIVFMGDGPMLVKCKAEASRSMVFLGHVEHGSNLFWSALRHARVVCLPSGCETPGIAGLEGAAVGARPVVPHEGGTSQYYGWDGEYHNPSSIRSIKEAVMRAWERGRLTLDEQQHYRDNTWDKCAKSLVRAYKQILGEN